MSKEELRKDVEVYYVQEFERIVNRFIWNASRIYGGNVVYIKLCRKEALKQIEECNRRAFENKVNAGALYRWGIRTIEQYYIKIFTEFMKEREPQ